MKTLVVVRSLCLVVAIANTLITSADPPRLMSMYSEGPSPIAFQDLSSGINAQIGVLAGECPSPEITGASEFVVNLQRNDGDTLFFAIGTGHGTGDPKRSLWVCTRWIIGTGRVPTVR